LACRWKNSWPWCPIASGSAPFLAQIGRLLIAQGRYSDALDHLERAIMFDPDMASAQLDYAIALAGSGDLLSARQLLDNIIAQPTTTAELRKALIQAKQRLPRAAGLLPVPAVSEGPLTIQLGANLRSGHDSNLLGAPSLTSLELTFPGEVIELPLTENNFPRPGAYTRSEAKLELSYQNADGGRWGPGGQPNAPQQPHRARGQHPPERSCAGIQSAPVQRLWCLLECIARAP
jgi:tetratricopeptide (TPR) repeat protein